MYQQNGRTYVKEKHEWDATFRYVGLMANTSKVVSQSIHV